MMTRAFKSSDGGALSVLSGNNPIDFRTKEIALRRLLLSNIVSFSPRAHSVINEYLPLAYPKQQVGDTPGRCYPSTSNILSQTDLLEQQRASEARGIRMAITSAMATSWASEWKDAVQGATTRSFFPTPACFKRLRMNGFPHQVIQILTGHSWLNVHLHRIGFLPSPMCSCSIEPETIEHYLFSCANHTLPRKDFISVCINELKQWPPSLVSLHKFPKAFVAMARFILDSGRLDGRRGRADDDRRDNPARR